MQWKIYIQIFIYSVPSHTLEIIAHLLTKSKTKSQEWPIVWVTRLFYLPQYLTHSKQKWRGCLVFLLQLKECPFPLRKTLLCPLHVLYCSSVSNFKSLFLPVSGILTIHWYAYAPLLLIKIYGLQIIVCSLPHLVEYFPVRNTSHIVIKFSACSTLVNVPLVLYFGNLFDRISVNFTQMKNNSSISSLTHTR